MIALTSCEHIRKVTAQPSNSLVITDQLFECGAVRPANWPSNEVLATWAAADILERGNEYWFWGMSCEQQLYFTGQYLKCEVNKEKDACNVVKGLRETINATP